jgi:hypothetical protein
MGRAQGSMAPSRSRLRTSSSTSLCFPAVSTMGRITSKGVRMGELAVPRHVCRRSRRQVRLACQRRECLRGRSRHAQERVCYI